MPRHEAELRNTIRRDHQIGLASGRWTRIGVREERRCIGRRQPVAYFCQRRQRATRVPVQALDQRGKFFRPAPRFHADCNIRQRHPLESRRQFLHRHVEAIARANHEHSFSHRTSVGHFQHHAPAGFEMRRPRRALALVAPTDREMLPRQAEVTRPRRTIDSPRPEQFTHDLHLKQDLSAGHNDDFSVFRVRAIRVGQIFCPVGNRPSCASVRVHNSCL